MLATSLDLPPRVQSTVVIPSSKAEKKLRLAFEQLAGGDKRLGSSSLLSHGPVFQIEVVLLLYGSEQGANSHLFWRIAASPSDCWFVKNRPWTGNWLTHRICSSKQVYTTLAVSKDCRMVKMPKRF
jgi:hypothetical protein